MLISPRKLGLVLGFGIFLALVRPWFGIVQAVVFMIVPMVQNLAVPAIQAGVNYSFVFHFPS